MCLCVRLVSNFAKRLISNYKQSAIMACCCHLPACSRILVRSFYGKISLNLHGRWSVHVRYCFIFLLLLFRSNSIPPPLPPLNWGWKSARRERKVGIRSQFYDTPKSFFAVFVPDWSTKICRKHSGFCWIMYSSHSRTGHIHTLEFNIAAPGRKRHVRILPFLFIVIPSR